jgi:hypothetical protein
MKSLSLMTLLCVVLLTACGESSSEELRQLRQTVEAQATQLEQLATHMPNSTPNPTATPTDTPTATTTPTFTPTETPTPNAAAPESAAPDVQTMLAGSQPAAPAGQQSAPHVSLKYDETKNGLLTNGQTQLIARYLRIDAPISQASLEAAISKIQQEAAATQATTFEGPNLRLDQRQAWLVWCSDATRVNPPADISLIHEVTLLDPNTRGRVWIQVPFASGVPLRSDDTWEGCNSPTGFWAVAVH